jgi:hypothetical protein
MTTKDALHLALAILEPFGEAGNIYDDYKADEGFTDEQYAEMVATLKSMEAEASGQPLGNFGDFFQEVMSDLVSHHGWDDPYGTITPQYNPDGSLLDLIHRHYHLGSDSGYVAGEINRVW